MAHTVLIRLTAMGDVLLAIPAARALRETASGENPTIHWVLSRKWQSLAPFLPARVHLVGSMAELLKTARVLRKCAPESVFDLQGKLSSSLLSFLLPGRKTQIKKRSLPEALQVIQKKFPLSFADSRPVWQKYLTTVSAPAQAFSHPDPRLVLPATVLGQSRAFLHRHGLREKAFVLFHPHASHVGKCLPREAVTAFSRRFSDTLVFMGEGIPPDASVPGVHLTNQIPLGLLPGIMSLSGGVISSDSGPMHLARACNVPVAAIFLQTDPSLGFAPIPGPLVKVFSRSLSCKPCSLHGQRSPCPIGTYECRKWNWPELSEEIALFLQSLKS